MGQLDCAALLMSDASLHRALAAQDARNCKSKNQLMPYQMAEIQECSLVMEQAYNLYPQAQAAHCYVPDVGA